MNTNAFKSFFKIFPTPKILAMPSVGVEISNEAIRFLEITERGGLRTLRRFGEYALSDSGDADTFPNTAEVKEKLALLKQKHKIDFVRASLPEDKAYIFSTDIPELSPDEMRAGLELKLEEHVPVPPHEAVFDYRIISVDMATRRFRVSVCVVPNLVVSRYLDVFLSAGLTPLSFELSAQAAVDALIKKGDHRPSVVVNIGKSDTRLYLVSRRTVHFTSLVSVGGTALTEAIKKYFKVSDAEAEKIKQERGISKRKEDAELFFSVGSTLSALKDEIEKLSAYWDTHRERYADTKEKLEQVILCGSESGLGGLPQYLEASLSVPVVLGNVWENIFSFDEYIPSLSRRDSLSYAVAAGLALKN